MRDSQDHTVAQRSMHANEITGGWIKLVELSESHAQVNEMCLVIFPDRVSVQGSAYGKAEFSLRITIVSKCLPYVDYFPGAGDTYSRPIFRVDSNRRDVQYSLTSNGFIRTAMSPCSTRTSSVP